LEASSTAIIELSNALNENTDGSFNKALAEGLTEEAKDPEDCK
jgi:hypothetical protein